MHLASATLQTVSPFAKVQPISSVCFPQFSELIRELDQASTQYLVWIHQAAHKSLFAQVSDGFNEAFAPYAQKREALLNALKAFAHDEFQ